jgi:hypothetical protein
MEHLYGKTHLEEDLLDLTFQLSPSSYFQVNTKGAEVLYSAITDLVEPTEDTTVLDLCCGTGGIGLCIAKVSNKEHRYDIQNKQTLNLCYFLINVLDIFHNSYHVLRMSMKFKHLMPLGSGFQSVGFWKIYAVKLK